MKRTLAAVTILMACTAPVHADWRDDLWWADNAVHGDGAAVSYPHYRYSSTLSRHMRWHQSTVDGEDRGPQVRGYIQREERQTERRAEIREDRRIRDEYRHEKEWDERNPADAGVHCHKRETVVGELAQTVDGALIRGERQFAATARYLWGERYIDLTNARGYKRRCDRISTNETLMGRAAEAVNREVGTDIGVQYRCIISAQPCKASMQDVFMGSPQK